MRHRIVRLLRGSPERTATDAEALLQGFERVLWVGPSNVGELRRWLGASLQAVVLDGHHPLPAEALGQAQGVVLGGGVLVLRLPERGAWPPDPRLAIPPFAVDDVGGRFADRVVAALTAVASAGPPTPPPGPPPDRGTAAQARVVDALRASLDGPPACAVLTARRGRGKSSALGLALRGFEGTVALTALHRRSVEEVIRFAGGGAWEAPEPLLLAPRDPPDLVVVDEAAALSVAWLQRLVQAFPDSHLWFATTTEGYEGTGRGFALRFGDWLAAQPRPLRRHTLSVPIRWAPDDPLEAALTDALILSPPALTGAGSAEPRHEVWDRDRLAGDERALQSIFGLLVHAHYRTTPGDLHRLLDAPNLTLHTLRQGDDVVAASIVAREGPLSPATVEALVTGQTRLRGQALPETLVCHAGVREAGDLRFARSVRIVTHPDHRRRGLARTLVDAIHDHHAPDAFGTLFGATAPVVRFRQAVGYELVRVGAARGARTGDPAAVMVRPVSDAAREVVDVLRARLARRLDAQLELLRSDEAAPLPDELARALGAGLIPDPVPLPGAEVLDGVRGYAWGPRPMEAVVVELRQFCARHPDALASLTEPDRQRIVERVLEGRAWWRLAQARGTTVPTEMRATRRAFAAFVELAEPLGS